MRQAAIALVVLVLMACTPHIDGVAVDTPGDHEVVFDHDGEGRTMLVHVPDLAKRRTMKPERSSRPLLVALHGGGSSGSGMAEVSGFSEVADRESFFVAYPDATAIAHGMWRVWNTGDCLAPACWLGVDDMGLVLAVVDVLRDRLPIDEQRVYLVGYSNGGSLAFSVAARHAHRFAGLGVFGASMTADGPVIGPIPRDPRPGAPLSVMTIHSDGDPWIPGNGKEQLARTEMSQAHVMQFWAAAARCPAPRRYRRGAERITHHRRCADGTEVQHIELSGWDHEWPGRSDLAGEEGPLRRFDAAETMWRFFSRHTNNRR